MSENIYELVYMSRLGDEYSLKALFRFFNRQINTEVEILLAKYKSLRFYEEDLKQEALIMVPKAIEIYREDKDCGIITFVYLVIKRKIYSTMRQYFSSNRIHLLNSVSFNSYIEENGGSYYVSGKQTIMKDPAYIAQYKEAVQRVEQVPLSNTEKQIFHLWVSGMSYKDASSILGMSYKTYDSHLQRIKKKVKKAIYA